MRQPIIFLIDDDAQVLSAIRRDVRKHYKDKYRIMAADSAREALEALTELRKQNEVVALFLSDQRMPEMLGVDFLREAKVIYPDAKRVLLTAYSDIDAAIRAINDVQLDYYLSKPWDPPEEKLYPVLDDLIEAWEAGYMPDFEGIRMIGYQWSPRSHQLKDYMAGNLIPFQWLDVMGSERARELSSLHELSEADYPALIFEDGKLLRNPEPSQVALQLGRQTEAIETMYDVVIIGAGPAGLAAAVYGASEGLKTLLIERHAPGGQAGTSSKIENYLGFPAGLSGADLTRRAITQATRFGTEFISPAEVMDIRIQDSYKILTLSTGKEINARSIVIATGVEYRKLEAESLDRFSGAGVYYGAANTEARACMDKDVYIVGGGNSAGQAAMHLSAFARNVHIVIRKEGLEATMSQYLIEQIKVTPNIILVPFTQVVHALGNDTLECLVLEDVNTKMRNTVPAGALFVFIGAKPCTDWLKLELLKSKEGYLLTGRDLSAHGDYKRIWKKERDPYLLETCQPGIFAAGDVRSGAMNRVASAVGEGSMSISFVHRYLSEE